MVDDDPALLDLACRFLRSREDLRIDSCFTAIDAMAKMAENVYDVIVLDYELPGMDGIQFLREVKGRGDMTPVIVFTGKGREGVVIEALNAGADFYLQKGGDPRMSFLELLYMIREAASRNRSRMELEESERRFRESLEQIPLISYQLDREGKITFCNEHFLELTGWTREEMTGENWFDLFIPVRDRTRMKRGYQKGIREGVASDRHFTPVITRDGEVRHVLLSSIANRSREGEIEGVTFVGEDVTERERATEEMRSSEERLKIIFEYAPDGFFLNDPAGVFVDVNRAAEQIMGYRREELIGKNFLTVGVITPEEITRAISLFTPNTGGQSQGPGELTLVRRDGSRVVVEMHTYPVMFRGRELILGIARDITERKHAEEALRRVNEKLHLLNSVTRHDILNTLTALTMYLELLAEDEKEPELKKTVDKATQVAGIIRRQIDFARTYQDIGIHSPVWQPVSRTALTALEGAGIAGVEAHVDAGDFEIYADPLLENVFHNLLDNSVRHGGKVTGVWLTAMQDERGLKLVFEDNGTGIPRDEKEKIFSRGFGKNTGFGLFLTQEILAITGITIKETGTFGKGARFEIRVPPGLYRSGAAKLQ
ncbi:PAS domain S-box-containing protein [Methanolinea mesophila]|uniref:PAS domain S-box protein n=1 Tax=Methanolinea mesophila TaxID=547055 RepID=UPI001AE96E8E|nr:PAS domain S-box protein [Methanolinea mesophila]MBP1929919.1 PAS domain S-box-containing protein [Methanolinea mesophila]